MKTPRPIRCLPRAPKNGEGLVSMAAIRRLARQIAERFHPEKIILFGSYAYGKPDRDSDVDLLVVIPAWDETSKACRIRETIDVPFALDLVVRTPKNLKWRLEEGDWFLREIVGKGKVLYAKTNRRLGKQGRSRSTSRAETGPRKAASS